MKNNYIYAALGLLALFMIVKNQREETTEERKGESAESDKAKETGEVKEIKFIDSEFISIENVTLKSIIYKFLRYIQFYIFKKFEVAQKDIYDVIKTQAITIFDEHNKFLVENELPTIKYEKIFKETKKQDYIM